jgi:hypothetical protein
VALIRDHTVASGNAFGRVVANRRLILLFLVQVPRLSDSSQDHSDSQASMCPSPMQLFFGSRTCSSPITHPLKQSLVGTLTELTHSDDIKRLSHRSPHSPSFGILKCGDNLCLESCL